VSYDYQLTYTHEAAERTGNRPTRLDSLAMTTLYHHHYRKHSTTNYQHYRGVPVQADASSVQRQS